MAYEPNDFGYRDSLPSGNPEKVIKGSDFDIEFNAIKDALNDISLDVDGIDGLQDALDEKADQDALDQEIADRENADTVLQNNLNQEIADREAEDNAIKDDLNNLTSAFNNHDHSLDELRDVSAGSPARDDLISWNGSQWEAHPFAFVDSILTFKGGISPTAAAPSNPEGGDVYVFDENGTTSNTWGGASNVNVVTGKFIGWADTDSDWHLLGDMADIGVTRVGAGVGIRVDDSQPSVPVVSIDRTETDKWYLMEHLWKENGDDIYYTDGNVGIGTQNIDESLVVQGSMKLRGANSVWFTNTSGLVGVDCLNSNEIKVINDNPSGQVALRTSGKDRLTIDSSGNVGIGRTDAQSQLEVLDNTKDCAITISSNETGGFDSLLNFRITGSTVWSIGADNSDDDKLKIGRGGTLNNLDSPYVTIDNGGNVGIGMDPTTGTFDLSAKEQLKEWKAKAKKASWIEVTDGAFEQEPKEEALAEWMETRAAEARLQVAGAGYFSGNVAANGGTDLTSTTNSGINLGGGSNVSVLTLQSTAASGANNNMFQIYHGDELSASIRANGNAMFASAVDTPTVRVNAVNNSNNALQVKGTTTNSNVYFRANGTMYRSECGGIQLLTGYIRPTDSTGAATPSAMSIGNAGNPFADAHFSGTVNATTINGRVTDVGDHIKAITPTQIANWDAGTGGGGGATTDGRISDNDIIHWNEAYGWGNHNDANYEAKGTAYTKGESDAKYELKGVGALPDGSTSGEVLVWDGSNWTGRDVLTIDQFPPGGATFKGMISADGFKMLGSTDSVVLLGAGGTKAVSDFAVSGDSYTKTETKRNVVMTEDEYNALGSKDAETIYFLT